MTIDPALATIIVAVITSIGGYFAIKAQNEGKKREESLDKENARIVEREAHYKSLEKSRDDAEEDAREWEDLYRASTDKLLDAEKYIVLLIERLRVNGLAIPRRKKSGGEDDG